MNSTRYFVTEAGEYIGAYCGVAPPDGAIEVPDAPSDASQLWQGNSWSELTPPRKMVLKSVVQARIIDAGKMPAAYVVLTQNPVYFARWFAPDHPQVYCDDPDAVSLVWALGLEPSVILAP